MALVLLVRFDEAQLQLLTTLSIELLQALEGLLDRLEQLQRGKPEPDDVMVPGSIDLQALVRELEAMSPEQRRALADGRSSPRSWAGSEAELADVDPSLYASTLVDMPRRSLPRYRLRESNQVPRYRSIAEKIAELKQVLKVEP